MGESRSRCEARHSHSDWPSSLSESVRVCPHGSLPVFAALPVRRCIFWFVCGTYILYVLVCLQMIFAALPVRRLTHSSSASHLRLRASAVYPIAGPPETRVGRLPDRKATRDAHRPSTPSQGHPRRASAVYPPSTVDARPRRRGGGPGGCSGGGRGRGGGTSVLKMRMRGGIRPCSITACAQRRRLCQAGVALARLGRLVASGGRVSRPAAKVRTPEAAACPRRRLQRLARLGQRPRMGLRGER